MISVRTVIDPITQVMRSRATVLLFFLFTIVLGLYVAKDYGISWDEKAMYVLGEEAYETVTKGEEYPKNIGIRYHGAWFEILQYAAQEMLGLRYARHIFIMRHMLNYLTFIVGLAAIYGIALRSFKSRAWALVAAILFFLSPRQFGHAFFNGRDIPAMSFFALKMLTLMFFLERPSIQRAVLHGVASSLVLSLRVGGLFVPIYTVLFFFIRAMSERQSGKQIPWPHYGKVLFIYFVAFGIGTIVFWPLLWDEPFKNFYLAMHNMVTTQNQGGGFYLGEHVGAPPWHWVPVHIFTKTPIPYLLLAVIGSYELLAATVRRPKTLLLQHRDLLLFFLWLVIPVAIVILLKADLFDEWRHIYFIYPAILLLAVSGLRFLWWGAWELRGHIQPIALTGISIATGLTTASTALWMVQNHPLQYVYFSLPSRYIGGKFELDYWGLSFRQGYEWVLAQDDDPIINFGVTSSPAWENLNILTQEQRQRIAISLDPPPKYVLDNFRWQEYKRTIPDEFKVHSIRVSGMEVLGIYKNPNWNPADAPTQHFEDFEVQLWLGADKLQ